MAGLAFSVLEIDGVPVPPPATEPQIESLIERLGDAGLQAIADAVAEERATPERKSTRGKLARHPVLIDCLYLVRNGVPFDVAFSLSAVRRTAYVIALGTLDGHTFDWSAFEWTTASTGTR